VNFNNMNILKLHFPKIIYEVVYIRISLFVSIFVRSKSEDMQEKLLYRIRVRGYVQGVGFRWNAAREAAISLINMH
jgi:hypothetical protein